MNPERTNDFQQLVMRHKSSIYSICYMFVERKEDADDLFQDVLINLWNGLSDFRDEARIETWIYRVSMNTCISYKRKKRIRTVPLEISSDFIDKVVSHGSQPDILRKRISSLAPIDRAIVLLWLENLPYDEIASIIGSTPKAIGVRLVRIKEKLKETTNKNSNIRYGRTRNNASAIE